MRQMMHAVVMVLNGVLEDLPLDDDYPPISPGASHPYPFFTYNIDLFGGTTGERFGSPTFTAALPLPTVHKFLLLACLVQRRSDDFLDFHLDCLSRIDIEYHLEGNYRFNWEDGFELGIPLARGKNGPVSWAERYRVELAFWTIHIDHLPEFERSYAFWDDLFEGKDRSYDCPFVYERERMWDAVIYLETMNEPPQITDFERLEHELRSSTGGFFPHKSGVPLNNPCLDQPPTDKFADAWEQDRSAARLPTSSWFFLDLKLLDRRGDTPFEKAIRKLGFNFWDLRRMCEMELFSVKLLQTNHCWHGLGGFASEDVGLEEGVGMRIATADQALFAWRSIQLDGERIAHDTTRPIAWDEWLNDNI